MTKTMTAAAALFALSVVGLAQTRPQPSPQTTFRATTRLVEVNVVAHDRDGNPARDLTAADFRVYEDGKAQAIEFFSVHADAPSAAPPAAARPASAGRRDFSNFLEGRAATAATVVLLDQLNTRWTDQAYARQQVVRFLRAVRPDDRIALYVLEPSAIRILHDFTSDTSSLLRALARYQGRTSREVDIADAPVPQFEPTGSPVDEVLDQWLREVHEDIVNSVTANRARATADALEALANHLAGVRGRKNLVWISSAFPIVIGTGLRVTVVADEVRRAARAVSSANVAIYPVDARGLVGPLDVVAATATRVVTGGRPSAVIPPSALDTVSPNIDTMKALAEDTGGRVFANTNDIAGAVRRAIDDARVTYVLGYYPAAAKWDGGFRRIKVEVRRPGVTARARNGYIASPKAVNVALMTTARSPLEATALRLSAHVEDVEAHGAADAEVRLALHLEAGGVSLSNVGDAWDGAVDVLIAQSLPDGQFFTSTDMTVTLHLTRDLHELALTDGVTLNRTLTLNPAATRLHVVVRDTTTGATGSLIIPIAALRGPSSIAPVRLDADPGA